MILMVGLMCINYVNVFLLFLFLFFFYFVEIFLVIRNYIIIYVERLFINGNCSVSLYILECRVITIILK